MLVPRRRAFARPDRAQHRETDRLNKNSGRAFGSSRASRSNVLVDGSLDYPDDVLDNFDFVVASIDGSFKLKAQNDRCSAPSRSCTTRFRAVVP
jgi:hypothetical protein